MLDDLVTDLAVLPAVVAPLRVDPFAQVGGPLLDVVVAVVRRAENGSEPFVSQFVRPEYMQLGAIRSLSVSSSSVSNWQAPASAYLP